MTCRARPGLRPTDRGFEERLRARMDWLEERLVFLEGGPADG